ncbi:HAMP domain-containing sensor histidine kinase [Clostridium sp. D33t1_170424_F3]|uniref:sensor histidine kinase n=1 Tax=Clostridium sp. D33t1_170424_F3 TaxID=2787099 RepID=UPI0018A987A4|nr:HAMP domain-containing sensor histidine kinase [Clostridium sp. D33t1_170424_F3]
MKKSGYRTVLHIYLLFFLSLFGTILAVACLSFLLITVQQPDGSMKRSDWPKTFTEDFREQILFIDNAPQIKQAGIALLHDNHIGLQILDSSGKDVYHYQKPQQAMDAYSTADLLHLYQTGQAKDRPVTAFVGTVSNEEKDYAYILYFPVKILKVTMYLNGERFTGGKTIVLFVLGVLFLVAMISGVLYGLWTTKAMKQLTTSIRDLSSRSYLPVHDHSAFRDLYDSLNALDAEIRASDQLQTQTEKMREEWIANITHDLKTPLSPIKGYAELLLEDISNNETQCKRYAGILLKNAAYMETLIDDLKLTYQLENGMLPMKEKEQNIVRFLRELVIDLLNTPDYENRIIHFESNAERIDLTFDQTLFTRAFRNLVINSFVHGRADTEVTLRVSGSGETVRIDLADNGNGMTAEETAHLFDRYYRGTSTEKKPEGSGLGLAIAKSIIERHGGTISGSSIPGVGTSFQILFPGVKVN